MSKTDENFSFKCARFKVNICECSRTMDSSDFEKAIRKGDFEAVKFLIDNENCDINQNIAHYVDPLGNIYF